MANLGTLSLLFAMLVVPVAAANTQFNYDGFYARLKKSEKAEFSHITLAFMLQKQQTSEPCDITGARITTDISSEPLTVAANGELILPFSELLNNRKALIALDQPKDAVPCDLNFRLRSKMALNATVELSELLKMHQQFDALLKELAGMGKYFLPAMTGVTLHFPAEVVLEDAAAPLARRVDCQQKQCQLDLTQSAGLDGKMTLQFNQAPEFVLPLLKK